MCRVAPFCLRWDVAGRLCFPFDSRRWQRRRQRRRSARRRRSGKRRRNGKQHRRWWSLSSGLLQRGSDAALRRHRKLRTDSALWRLPHRPAVQEPCLCGDQLYHGVYLTRRNLLRNDRRSLLCHARLWNGVPEGRVDMRSEPCLPGRSQRVSSGDLPGHLRGPLLWQDRGWLRPLARLRRRLSSRMGLCQQPLCGIADGVQSSGMYHGQRGPLLRNHRQRLRRVARLWRLPGGMDLRQSRLQGHTARVPAHGLHRG